MWGEAHSVDLLRNGLAAEYHLLLHPIPQCQHVVGRVPQAGQQAPITVEIHKAVGTLCTTCMEKGQQSNGSKKETSLGKDTQCFLVPFTSEDAVGL